MPELFLRLTAHGQLTKPGQVFADTLCKADEDAIAAKAVFLMAVPARALPMEPKAKAVLERIEARPAPAPAINTTYEPLPQFQQPRIGTLTPHPSLPSRPGAHPPPAETVAPVPAPLEAGTKPSLVPARRYWRLSATDPMQTALRRTTLVEWPEIEVWDRATFDSAVRRGYIEILPRDGVPAGTCPPRPDPPPMRAPPGGLVAYSDSEAEEDAVAGGGSSLGSLVGLLH